MQLNTLLSPLIKAFLHTEYCYCQYYSIDITLDILGYTLDILGLDILGLDILGLDILGLDILGLDILGLDILGLDILGYTPRMR